MRPTASTLRVLKRWPLTPLALLELPLRAAQPQRQIRGARRLAGAGVPTPQPVGSWRFGREGLIPVLTLQLEYAPGRTALAILEDDAVPLVDKRRFGRAVGCTVARLVEASLFNRDLKLANLVIDETAPDTRVQVIDPVGVRRMRDVAGDTERMLERLNVQPRRYGVALPRPVVIATLLTALRSLERPRRRAVLRRLRQRR